MEALAGIGSSWYAYFGLCMLFCVVLWLRERLRHLERSFDSLRFQATGPYLKNKKAKKASAAAKSAPPRAAAKSTLPARSPMTKNRSSAEVPEAVRKSAVSSTVSSDHSAAACRKPTRALDAAASPQELDPGEVGKSYRGGVGEQGLLAPLCAVSNRAAPPPMQSPSMPAQSAAPAQLPAPPPEQRAPLAMPPFTDEPAPSIQPRRLYAGAAPPLVEVGDALQDTLERRESNPSIAKIPPIDVSMSIDEEWALEAVRALDHYMTASHSYPTRPVASAVYTEARAQSVPVTPRERKTVAKRK